MDSSYGFVMNGGDGEESYTRNSSFQRSKIDSAKSLVHQSIIEHIAPLLTNSPTPQTFCIADLGCSVGPNTLLAVGNILDSISFKLSTHSHSPNNNNSNNNNNNNKTSAEFHVYFNDHTLNDFNTLFKSLPSSRDYHVYGAPGSFHGRLFPRGSIHVVHCSSALHWLSRAPSVTNPGRVFYSCGAKEEVVDAYSRRYAEDVSRFLNARAEEVVPGGLVMLIVVGRQDGVPHSRLAWSTYFDLLGECLVDMAKEGLFDEEKVDNFNFPIYFTSPGDLEEIIKENGDFTIERMEKLGEVKNEVDMIHSPQQASMFFKATISEIIRNHFGHEMIDPLFHRLFPRKLVKETNRIISSSPSIFFFVLLKRRQLNFAM